MEKCSHLLAVSPEGFRGKWLVEFGYETLHIELGCGKGRFTAEKAKAEPNVFIAALEKSADAMIIALERAVAANLSNIIFLNAYADNLTDFFADGEASRIYINFCDPWPSNRHVKRRLTNRRFLELYARVLEPGGEIHLKTDNKALFEYSLREFALSGFELVEITRDLHKDAPSGIMTDYELKFHSQGIPICRCVMRRQ